jgi:hypothetical protein
LLPSNFKRNQLATASAENRADVPNQLGWRVPDWEVNGCPRAWLSNFELFPEPDVLKMVHGELRAWRSIRHSKKQPCKDGLIGSEYE